MEYPSKNISLDFLLAQVLSVFTISLALGAYVRRNRIPEEERFVVALDDLYENRNTKKTEQNYCLMKKMQRGRVFIVRDCNNFIGGTTYGKNCGNWVKRESA